MQPERTQAPARGGEEERRTDRSTTAVTDAQRAEPTVSAPNEAASCQWPAIAEDLLRRTALADPLHSMPAHERTAKQRDELQRVDRSNARMLRDLLADRGWPGITLVGADAARAAWLTALRSDDAEFQSAVLPLLTAAVVAGEAVPAWWAHLYDRCCALTGVKQWFGTQFRSDSGGVEVHPVDDPENLDLRRAQYGLGPHAESLAALRRRHGSVAA